MITRKLKSGRKRSPNGGEPDWKRSVSFRATDENFAFLDERKKKYQTPYAYHVNRALDLYRQKEAA